MLRSMDDQTVGAIGRLFARDLTMDQDTHAARTAYGSVRLALSSLPQPDDWFYHYDENAEGPPTALLLTAGRLVEVGVTWEGSDTAVDLRAVGRRLEDGDAVIEMEWHGGTIDNEVLHHATAWAFKFSDGARIKVPGLIRTRPGEDEVLDDGERFGREVASRLGQRP
jgi:hypothetical protein